MNKYIFDYKTPGEISRLIAGKVRSIRKRRNWSQVKLSDISGVSLGSIKRFERSGEISLISLIKIAISLNCENELEKLFEEVPFESIREVLDGQN